jgi:hypothetical protein
VAPGEEPEPGSPSKNVLRLRFVLRLR